MKTKLFCSNRRNQLNVEEVRSANQEREFLALESNHKATVIRNCLTNTFHVAVCLFSNRSQMTSKCGKNKKVAHEAIAECVTDVLTTF